MRARLGLGAASDDSYRAASRPANLERIVSTPSRSLELRVTPALQNMSSLLRGRRSIPEQLLLAPTVC